MQIQLQKENSMLKQYHKALQTELKIRQRQKIMLQDRIDTLKHQYNLLVDDLSNPQRSRLFVNQIDNIQRDLKYLQTRLNQSKSRFEVSIMRNSALQIENKKLCSNRNTLSSKLYDLQAQLRIQQDKQRNQYEQLQKLREQNTNLKKKVQNIQQKEKHLQFLRIQNSNLIADQQGLKKFIIDDHISNNTDQQVLNVLRQAKRQINDKKIDQIYDIQQIFQKKIEVKDKIITQMKRKLKKEQQNSRNTEQTQTIIIRHLKISLVDLRSRIMLAQRQKWSIVYKIRTLQLSLKDKQLSLITRQKSFSQLYKLYSLFNKKSEEVIQMQQIIAALRQKTKTLEIKIKQLQNKQKQYKNQGVNRQDRSQKQYISEINHTDSKLVRQVELFRTKIHQKQEEYKKLIFQTKKAFLSLQNQNIDLKKRIQKITEQNNVINDTYRMIKTQKPSYSRPKTPRSQRFIELKQNQKDLKDLISQLKTQLKDTKEKTKKLQKQNRLYKKILNKQQNSFMLFVQNTQLDTSSAVKSSTKIKKSQKHQENDLKGALNSARSGSHPNRDIKEQSQINIKQREKNQIKVQKPLQSYKNKQQMEIDKKIKFLKQKNEVLKQQLCY